MKTDIMKHALALTADLAERDAEIERYRIGQGAWIDWAKKVRDQIGQDEFDKIPRPHSIDSMKHKLIAEVAELMEEINTVMQQNIDLREDVSLAKSLAEHYRQALEGRDDG